MQVSGLDLTLLLCWNRWILNVLHELWYEVTSFFTLHQCTPLSSHFLQFYFHFICSLQKLEVVVSLQLGGQEIPRFYANRRPINVIKKPIHCETLLWDRRFHCLRYTLFLAVPYKCHPLSVPGLGCDLFLVTISTEILYRYRLLRACYMSHPSHPPIKHYSKTMIVLHKSVSMCVVSKFFFKFA
jgi:hypothetical protein